MKHEEYFLNSKLGHKNPFTVPEGYFDSLAEQVMSRLPAELPRSSAAMSPVSTELPRSKATVRRLRPWLLAAACTCVAVFTVALLLSGHGGPAADSQQVAVAAQDGAYYYSDTYIDEEADYAMVDNQEIYACLLADM